MLLSFTGNVAFEPTEGDRPANVALAFSLQYTQKALLDLVYTGPVTNQAISPGTLTAPKGVLIEVSSGSISFSWDSGGDGAEVLKANPSPPPAQPAIKFLATYDTNSRTLYVTTTGPAVGRVWFFS